MTAMTTGSYTKHISGAECSLLGADPGHPCWGRVRVVDTLEEDEAGKPKVQIFGCEGHFEKVKIGYRAAYKKEKIAR